MRLLVITPSWPSVRAPYNGVFIREHCRALVNAGHEVHVLAPRVFRDDPLDTLDHGIPVRRFRYPSGQRLLAEHKGIPKMKMVAYLALGILAGLRAVVAMRPSVMIAHWVVPMGFVGGIVSRISGIPMITVAHGGDIARTSSAPVRAAARVAVRNASAIVCVSDRLKRQLLSDLGAHEEQLHVASMGVDLALFRPRNRLSARSALRLHHEDPIVLFVGNVSAEKGIPELIKAFAQVNAERADVHLSIAGTGTLSGELTKLVRDQGLPEGRVDILGPVPHDELPVRMAAADLIVLPSHAEGLPVSLMEAAAVGLPVVASDVGAVREVVALDERSKIVPPGDVEALAKAILEVLDGPMGPRRSMVAAGSPMDQQTHVEMVVRLMRTHPSID